MKMLAWTAAAVLGCALIAAPASAHAQGAARVQRQDRNRIAAEEIAQSHAANVYQLVQARRGMWLMRNNHTPLNTTGSGKMLVFLDGAELDAVEDLRQIPAAGVQLVEFLTPAQTERRMGKYTTVGAIRVSTRDETPRDSAHAAHQR
ncbi:MAG TPA: hypothetical protein VEX86_01830 [Longimicrobium sp.]|nr:hypothetical protein [Longimicrobium sp.]